MTWGSLGTGLQTFQNSNWELGELDLTIYCYSEFSLQNCKMFLDFQTGHKTCIEESNVLNYISQSARVIWWQWYLEKNGISHSAHYYVWLLSHLYLNVVIIMIRVYWNFLILKKNVQQIFNALWISIYEKVCNYSI